MVSIFPEDTEENPWTLIERIEVGLCHKRQPLHFIGKYRIKDSDKFETIKDYNIKSLELWNLNPDFNQPIPDGVEKLILYDLPNFNQPIPGGVEKLKLDRLQNFNQPIPGGVENLELSCLPNFNQLIPIGVETLKLWNLPNLKTNNVPKRFRHYFALRRWGLR